MERVRGYAAILVTVLACTAGAVPAGAADVVPNGTFDTDLSGWVHVTLRTEGVRDWDGSVFGAAPGSFRYITDPGRRSEFEGEDTHAIPTPIDATDTVTLSLYWYKTATTSAASNSTLEIYAVHPDGSTENLLWTDTQTPNAGQVLDGNVIDLDVSSLFEQTGLYSLKVYGRIRSGNSNGSTTQFNLDDIVLDVTPAGGNNAPVIAGGATGVSVSPVNRFGAETTTLSTTFTDSDQPGVGAFAVTFRIREPNNTTELTLVNAQTDGNGGLSIADNGGGSYTASYTYDPSPGQALGLYDLFCEVSDGTDLATDGYAANPDELEINEVLPNNAPSIVAGATGVSKSPVARSGSDTTTLSTTFTDADQPGINAFTVNFKVRRPNNTTEDLLATAATHGTQGVTVTDNGGGSYTAQLTWDPPASQPLGLHDLYFDVSDGTDSAVDGYAANLDELEVVQNPPANPPQVTGGATQVSPASVNRQGTGTTVVSATFTDADQPGPGAFTVTFKVREPDNATEVILVNAQTDGNGGLSITDNGGGSYTASYTYDPSGTQALGFYDLHFDVGDGTGTAVDDYTANPDELEITQPANNPPVLAAGATTPDTSPVNRAGTASTTLSATFTDADQPGIGAFTVSFKIREPDNSTEVILVDAQTDGNGGLSITDNGGGSYTASFVYDPAAGQVLGFYDLQTEVSDGIDGAVDAYSANNDELEIVEFNVPTVAAGATQVSDSPVNRLGTDSTVVSATFSDADQPGIGAFTVTFKIREPDDVTEWTLVNAQTHGNGGLAITDNGGGSYTAAYTYDPSGTQPLGLYDLHFEVDDGTGSATDSYGANPDELQINEVVPNAAPVVASGATRVLPVAINRNGTGTTTLSATFTDADDPGIGAFTVTFKIREPDNATEITVVNQLGHGVGGVTIQDNTGSYTAKFDYDPPPGATLGFYDLWFEVSDGTDTALDDYAGNLDELQIVDIPINAEPTLTPGATAVAPPSIDRFGPATTQFSVAFNDADDPGIGTFAVTFAVRAPYSSSFTVVADALLNGQGGMSVTSLGGGDYTAAFDWDPPDTAVLGYYDLYALVSDGEGSIADGVDDNPDELLLTNGGENIPPVVPGDATVASPAGVERIGANSTTLSATYTDADQPGVGAFTVTFKLRLPADAGELVLASDVGNGVGGVTITDGGGGIYTASIDWDPPDAQDLGTYDLYFHVSDGTDTSVDGFPNNLEELEVFDAISNQPPTLTAGATSVLPAIITRLGSDYTMLQASFSDADQPGPGAFQVTFKVRDSASQETIVVNAAAHQEQGVRIRHVSGGDYQASVLWDPPVGQVTGTYDLRFEVVDNAAASTADDYADNLDELTVTATAIPGDGFLLRRTHDSETCTSCHDMPEHQNQSCLVCHTPHGTPNIFMVRDTIQTPNSGPMPVLFKTLGFGDPDNDPDPVLGDPNSGAMADDTDGVFTNVCEVCHTNTGHHTNDGSHPPPAHHNAENCTGCHPHSDGFPKPADNESTGGQNCNACHSGLVSGMTSTAATSYHHLILSDSPDYTVSNKTCLMCHVDHDIFRPDENPGFGARAKNLRVDITTPVVQGSNAVMTDSDYLTTGTGGICLSCHTSVQTKGYPQPDGSTETPIIPRTDFDAATGSHNYSVQSRFGEDGSFFNANCSKCHSDMLPKTYQDTPEAFGTHNGGYRSILFPFDTASPTDPLEEDNCFACHSTVNNPNAGSNEDYFRVQPMSNQALQIETVLGYSSAHPVTTYRDRHGYGETGADFADGATRHAECTDCHDVHAAQPGTHDGSSNLVSNPLKGAWGVEPTAWPAAPTPTDNGNVYVAPASYTRVEPAVKEYQICLKCHSNYTTLPSGKRNLAEEINPNYPSTHGIVQAGTNPFCNSTTMFEPWGSSGFAYCSDCHRSSNPADPEGPHGSNIEFLLVASVVSDDVNGTPLCNVCHRSTTYWDGDAAASKYPKHPATQGSHQLAQGCFACHMWDYSSTAGLGAPTTDWPGGNPPPGIHVHGMNKKWVYNEQDGTAGSGQDVDAFVNGYIANIDYTAQECWAEVCKGHSGQGY